MKDTVARKLAEGKANTMQQNGPIDSLVAGTVAVETMISGSSEESVLYVNGTAKA